MRVSVVLCTYSPNLYDHFKEAAESVLNQSYDDVELVVVVDGSDPVYQQVLEDFGGHESVVFHRNEQNRGLLESRNTGAELASGDIVSFIDDDAVAEEQWIAELVSAYETHDIVAAGGRMTAEWIAEKPVFLPEEFYWLVGVTHKGFAEGPGEVRNTFGSNLSFRRDVFLDLEGFDPAIGGRKGRKNLQGGETELCARLHREYGKGVWYVPSAKVAHKVFPYRTRARWLLNRAFWQGYSKRVMEGFVSEPGREENQFLRTLLLEFLPERLRNLIRRPTGARIEQLLMLGILTSAVGVGYLFGMVSVIAGERQS